MLRVWGGGFYEKDIFYNLCDEMGIMIWQDFMFACSPYPDFYEWFANECDKEIDYQTKRLSKHSCIVLFCGNNENQWTYSPKRSPHFGLDFSYNKQFGFHTANFTAREIVRRNCNHIPYWNSSPYGGENAESPYIGNVHQWNDNMMHPDIDVRIEPKAFDNIEASFVTEYGYPGAPQIETIKQYFDGAEVDRQSSVWNYHKNGFEKQTVNAGIEKHYPVKTDNLTIDEYIFYSGMVQSLMLEYSLSVMRSKLFCAGSLFWMYNDTWGEIGWTIIDYYARRKISYYGVKRAFSPMKIILTLLNGTITAIGCNDTEKDITFTVKIGYLSFNGDTDKTETVEWTMPKRSRNVLLTMKLPNEDYLLGVFAVIPQCDNIGYEYLRIHDIKKLNLSQSEVEIISEYNTVNCKEITIVSNVFVHSVHILEDLMCSDNYFDLLPNVKKTFNIQCDKNHKITLKKFK